MTRVSHGGKDPGAVGPAGLKEKDVALQVSLAAAKLLRQNGVEVKLTRESDTAISLGDRCQLANAWPADLFLSIHCNASAFPEAHGTETYCYTSGGRGEALAKAVQLELVTYLGRINRGVKDANFYVLRETIMPAALAELAFISNPQEEHLLADSSFQQQCAMAIARGVLAYAGIPYSKEKEEGNMLDKIVVYFGDVDALSAIVVAQKLQAPVMRKTDFNASGLRAKDIIYIGGTEGNRFDTFKRAAQLL